MVFLVISAICTVFSLIILFINISLLLFLDRRAVCGHRPGTAEDEFRSALCSVHSKTLSLIALDSRRVLE